MGGAPFQSLGVHHRDREHDNRGGLVQQGERERRLVEKRDDAERGL
jgi:hypothetical protein